ncbi:hypothetical protein BU17DRAFT_71549 [Hysterangium stoloniferum]|nr:hypothetical protein BU17DRAFT_71549 [Hysterangium stoloniferum]
MAFLKSLLILAATFQLVLAVNGVNNLLSLPKGVQSLAIVPSPIPTECQGNCSSPVSLLQTCAPPIGSCLCTPTFQTGLFNCYICLGGVQRATDYDQAQRDLDLITTSCDAFSLPLPKLTLPGEDPNRIISTAALPSGVSGTVLSPPLSSSPVSSANANASTGGTAPSSVPLTQTVAQAVSTTGLVGSGLTTPSATSPPASSSSGTGSGNGADSIGFRPSFAIFGVAATWIALYGL